MTDKADADSSGADGSQFETDADGTIKMPDLAELGIETDPDTAGSADLDIGGELDIGAGDRDLAPAPVGRTGGRGPGPRLVGLLAMLLGAVGTVLMVVLAALSIRAGFTASDIVDRAMEPVEVAFDRMETRIDETDDLVDRDGIPAERVDELQARVDGLVDLSTGAQQVFESIEDHPLYRLLPAELSTLSAALTEFETSAEAMDRRLGNATDGDRLEPAVANAVADELDGLQGKVRSVRELLVESANSLRSWIRFGTFLGFLGSLWGLWAQISLTRRGWRGFRGRPI